MQILISSLGEKLGDHKDVFFLLCEVKKVRLRKKEFNGGMMRRTGSVAGKTTSFESTMRKRRKKGRWTLSNTTRRVLVLYQIRRRARSPRITMRVELSTKWTIVEVEVSITRKSQSLTIH
jgi:hypothetical protein